MRREIELIYQATFQLKQATQRDATTRCAIYQEWRNGKAYKALPRKERGAACKAKKEELGLTLNGMQAIMRKHCSGNPFLQHYVTSVQIEFHASEIYETTKRHLTPNKSGKFNGPPKVKCWFDHSKLIGRARSHTVENSWLSFRLVGSYEAHIGYFGNADCSIANGEYLKQPSVMPSPHPRKNADWWTYDGPLVVVYPKGDSDKSDLILPVRLPSGLGEQERLEYYLDDPNSWHKIDITRVQDRKAPGGWRYYAHLLVNKVGYASAATLERRSLAPTHLTAALDSNVSNIAVVSQPRSVDEGLDDYSLNVHIIKPRGEAVTLAANNNRRKKKKQRKLDNSRRVANPEQYELSKGQKLRAERRAADGLSEIKVEVPKGPRVANSRKIPKQVYRKDVITRAYRKTKAELADLQRSEAQRKDAEAALMATDLVMLHGIFWLSESVNMVTWMRLWGKSMVATTPGRVTAAIAREARACSGSYEKLGTRNTKLSQTCLCGRVEKKSLKQRWHSCSNCGLEADRDVLSAALGTAVKFSEEGVPSSAFLDEVLVAVLRRRVMAQQGEPVQLTLRFGDFVPTVEVPGVIPAELNILGANPTTEGVASAAQLSAMRLASHSPSGESSVEKLDGGRKFVKWRRRKHRSKSPLMNNP